MTHQLILRSQKPGSPWDDCIYRQQLDDEFAGQSLDSSQLESAIKICQWLYGGTQYPFFTLTGYGGSGKTYTLAKIIKVLSRLSPRASICATAVSNQATSVFKRELEKNGVSSVPAQTLASLLGIRPKINTVTGREEFKPDPRKQPSFQHCDLVICDECSQIGVDLLGHIRQAANDYGVMVLFVGDPAQLRPINEKPSQTFDLPPDFKSHITGVRRYGGALAEQNTLVRDDPEWLKTLHVLDKQSDDYWSGVFPLTLDAWGNTAVRAISKAESLDDARIVTYTNKRRRYLNRVIKDAKYPDTPRFVPDMELVAKKPYEEGHSTLFKNADELRVLDTAIGSEHGLKLWILELEKVHNLDDDSPFVAYAVHGDSLEEFKRRQDTLKAKRQWKEFWDAEKRYAHLDYPWALTSHSAQGGTFKDVWIDQPDLAKIRFKNPDECRELFYVAYSRASRRQLVNCR